MSSQRDQKSTFQERLNEKYRLVILNDDTLGEVRSLKFTIFSFLGLLSAFIILTALLMFALVSYSPLRYLVPGYGEIESHQVFIDLNKKLKALEEEFEAQRVYTQGFKAMLNADGDVPILNDSISFSDLPRPADNGKSAKSSLISIEHFYFCEPLTGNVSSEFHLGKKHFGVDIVAPKNTPIKSILDGKVISADWSEEMGNTISIQHANNMVSVYKHNAVLLKRTGDKVSCGEPIAIIGNTGVLSTGPHLHFELWNNGEAVNPLDYININ